MKPAGSIHSLAGASEYCSRLLKVHDRSGFIIQQYFPKSLQNVTLGIKAFSLETARIAETVTKPEIAKMRFDFWRSTIQKALRPISKDSPVIKEPIALLLASSRDHTPLSRRFFITLIQTRESFMLNKPFRNLDTMAQYGEGTFSQVGYLTQEALEQLVPESEISHTDLASEIIAHIGQASAIAQFLKAFPYYLNTHRVISLPTNLMAQHDLSQESIYQGDYDPRKLADVTFDTAVRANDHMISARSKLNELKNNVGTSKLSDATFVPLMAALPAQLYLERLESVNFDLLSSKLQTEWKLPYRTWRAYKTQSI